MFRFASLALFLGVWWLGALYAGEQMLPGPATVLDAVVAEARSGELFLHLGATLLRVALAFALAMAAGTAIGLLMGRVAFADRIGDPWLVVLLNLPALVIIVLAYVWGGLTETAAIAAVAVNKLPNAIVTVREGARALDSRLDEMARVFAMPRRTVLRHVVLLGLGLEDRAGRRAAGPAEWSGISDRHCVPALRRDTYSRLCPGVRWRDVVDREPVGATA